MSSYRFAPALLARAYGALLVACGVLVVVSALVVWALGLPTVTLTVVVTVVLVLVVLAAGVAARRVTLVRFDEHGYQVRLVRGAGVKAARWRDVEDAVTATVAGQRCVVLRLRDGRTTTLPVGVLDTTGEAFLRDLGTHLDRGHGYRRIR